MPHRSAQVPQTEVAPARKMLDADPPSKPRQATHPGAAGGKCGEERKEMWSPLPVRICVLSLHTLQLEKGKNPARLNKQLDWGRVELAWVENLRKQENGVAKERGGGEVTSSQEAAQRFACKAAGDQGPTSPTARSREDLSTLLCTPNTRHRRSKGRFLF